MHTFFPWKTRAPHRFFAVLIGLKWSQTISKQSQKSQIWQTSSRKITSLQSRNMRATRWHKRSYVKSRCDETTITSTKNRVKSARVIVKLVYIEYSPTQGGDAASFRGTAAPV
jgi:hypothetical protein